MGQRRDNGHWEVPGGVLERPEDITAGLVREIREETGLRVEPVSLTGVYKNMPRGVVALVFRCTKVGGSTAASDEMSAFRWVTAEEARALALEAFAVRVVDAMEFRGTPAIRHHDGTHLLNA
jgi:8-oxo-dGTP pyrophosphatase MutT (NUDIX family)